MSELENPYPPTKVLHHILRLAEQACSKRGWDLRRGRTSEIFCEIALYLSDLLMPHEISVTFDLEASRPMKTQVNRSLYSPTRIGFADTMWEVVVDAIETELRDGLPQVRAQLDAEEQDRLDKFLNALSPKKGTQSSAQPTLDDTAGTRLTKQGQNTSDGPDNGGDTSETKSERGARKQKLKTIEKHRKAWGVICQTRREYKKSFDSADTDNPTPTLTDLQEALKGKGIPYSIRTIQTIITDGEAGKFR